MLVPLCNQKTFGRISPQIVIIISNWSCVLIPSCLWLSVSVCLFEGPNYLKWSSKKMPISFITGWLSTNLSTYVLCNINVTIRMITYCYSVINYHLSIISKILFLCTTLKNQLLVNSTKTRTILFTDYFTDCV